MILLTGATGKTGFAAASALARAGYKARVVTRDAARAEKLKALGHEIVVGDLARPAFVADIVRGVERALLIMSNTERQGSLEAAFTDAAVAAGVRHIVKLSSIEAHSGIGARVPEMHAASEAHIKASGLAWTMVKPNFFMQTLLAGAAGVRSRGELTMPMGAARISMIDCRDVGEVIAKSLIESGHAGKSYLLTGSEAVTLGDVASRLTRALGRDVRYVDPPLATYRNYLAQAIPDPWRVDAVCEIFAMTSKGRPEIATITNTFDTLMGRSPIGLDRFIVDYRPAFTS